MSAADVFGGGIAVITGAGSGVGAGLARHASSIGMTVVIADIDGDAARRVREELTAAGGSAVDIVCDVRDPDAVSELAYRIYKDIGPVRLLVNNAGVEQVGYLWDTPVANWQRLIDVNISGVFHGVRAFLPKMMATDDQAWVWNLSSVGGVTALPLQAPYITSKHAVLALTECLNLEVQQAGHHSHIHVQAVLPGPVKSNIFQSAGGVDGVGRSAETAEELRSAMVGVTTGGMDPVEAARVVFEQAAAGGFYLSTDPDLVAGVMKSRANVLASQQAPTLFT